MAVLLPQSEKSWDSRADIIPSLYVFECVELELALTLAAGDDEPCDSDFSCPIKLHRGNVPALTWSHALPGTLPCGSRLCGQIRPHGEQGMFPVQS